MLARNLGSALGALVTPPAVPALLRPNLFPAWLREVKSGSIFNSENRVFGLEADADWSNQQTSQTFPVVNVPWLATARMRIGYAYDRIVVYATGGAGYVQLKSTTVDNVVSSSAHTAWVVGIGRESAITRNVLLRFEVLYLQLLGNADTPAGAVSSTQTVYDVIARVGLSYKFDWPINN